MAKKKTINQRVDALVLDELQECLDLTGVTKALFIEMSARAFIDYVRANGQIPMPFAVAEKNAPTPVTGSKPSASSATAKNPKPKSPSGRRPFHSADGRRALSIKP